MTVPSTRGWYGSPETRIALCVFTAGVRAGKQSSSVVFHTDGGAARPGDRPLLDVTSLNSAGGEPSSSALFSIRTIKTRNMT